MKGCGWEFITGFFVFFMLICSIPNAQAWSNGGYSADPLNPDYGTHDWIAEKALLIQAKDVSFLSTIYHAKYLLGTEAPDNSAYIGDSYTHHVYYYASGTVQESDGATRAAQMYDLALSYLNANDKQNAAYYIGAMAHYISDLAVFGHTMGSGTDWGAEVHHSDYESYVESMIGSLPSPSGLTLDDKYASNAALDLAKDTTFGKGAVKSNIWMDTNYNGANSLFKASAKASLNASIVAVAAAINHLMIATAPTNPPATPPSAPPEIPTDPLPEVPRPPASLIASIENAHIVIAWTSPTNNGGASITDFKIYRGTDQNAPTYVTTVSKSVFSWTDESAVKGVTYYYWVSARNSVGESNISQIASAMIPDDSGTIILAILLSSISATTASGGFLVWRRRKRRRN